MIVNRGPETRTRLNPLPCTQRTYAIRGRDQRDQREPTRRARRPHTNSRRLVNARRAPPSQSRRRVRLHHAPPWGGGLRSPITATQEHTHQRCLPPLLASSNHNLSLVAVALSPHSCHPHMLRTAPCPTCHHHHHAPRTPTIEAPVPFSPARASAMPPYSSRPLAAQASPPTPHHSTDTAHSHNGLRQRPHSRLRRSWVGRRCEGMPSPAPPERPLHAQLDGARPAAEALEGASVCTSADSVWPKKECEIAWKGVMRSAGS